MSRHSRVACQCLAVVCATSFCCGGLDSTGNCTADEPATRETVSATDALNSIRAVRLTDASGQLHQTWVAVTLPMPASVRAKESKAVVTESGHAVSVLQTLLATLPPQFLVVEKLAVPKSNTRGASDAGEKAGVPVGADVFVLPQITRYTVEFRVSGAVDPKDKVIKLYDADLREGARHGQIDNRALQRSAPLWEGQLEPADVRTFTPQMGVRGVRELETNGVHILLEHNFAKDLAELFPDLWRMERVRVGGVVSTGVIRRASEGEQVRDAISADFPCRPNDLSKVEIRLNGVDDWILCAPGPPIEK